MGSNVELPTEQRQASRLSLYVVMFLSMVLFSAGVGNAEFGESTQFFPHFVLGGGWVTVFTIHNPSTTSATVQIQMFRSDGSLFLTRDVTLAAAATQTVKIEPTPVLTAGWARLTSTGRFSASELFQFLGTDGQLISEVGVLPSTSADQFKLFGMVQTGIGSSTGIAVANPSAASESVLTVRRRDSSGAVQDTRTIHLGPLQQLARFLNEDPYFTGLDNYEGIVEVSATQPVTAVTLRLDGSQVAAVGVITPLNVITDSDALYRTALGFGALISNTTGAYNTATGVNALRLNTTGHDNTASGVNALRNNTTGFSNTASGVNALQSNTTGDSNTASGREALQANTTGVINTASGVSALGSNTTGSSNTASGSEALQANTTGSGNTASGRAALQANTTGTLNTAIGAFADVSSGNLTNATAIGNGARVNASNKIRLGNSSVTVIEGQVAYTFSSDKTKKENFRPVDAEDVLNKIQNLDVTSWNYIGNDPQQFRHYGPMAQDFFAAFGHDDVGTIGTPTTLTSGDVDGILMIGLKALRHENELLKAAVDEVRAELKSQWPAFTAARLDAPVTSSEETIEGNVDLDSNGEASVELPPAFETLHREFRYQLTAIGAPGSSLYIAEVQNGRFKIAGGRPGAKASWKLTAVGQNSPGSTQKPLRETSRFKDRMRIEN